MLFCNPKEPVVLIYDKVLKRPACAILQSAMGGTPGLAAEFHSRLWLTMPTPNLKPYTLLREQLDMIVEGTNRANADLLR